MATELEQALEAYDGRAVTLLSEAQAAYRDAPDYIADVIRLCVDPRGTVSDGATWILKDELERGVTVSPSQVSRLVATLGQITSWQAKLHICQAVSALELTEDQAADVVQWVSPLTEHERPFLRAWSLHALVNTAERFKRFRDTADAALARAEDDRAASVRARVRNLRARR